MDVVEAGAAAVAGLRDLENLRLGLVEQLPDLLARGTESAVGDLRPHGDELAHHRALADDLRVAADVVRRGRVLRERAEIGEAARPVLVLARLDRFGDRDDVGRPAVLDQPRDVAVDAPMVVAVEVVEREDVADLVPRAVVEQQTAEHRLLGLDRMRRDAQRDELRIGGSLGEGLRHVRVCESRDDSTRAARPEAGRNAVSRRRRGRGPCASRLRRPPGNVSPPARPAPRP